jgi:tRNA threonylcarbamoyladenosine biosynthesis protein TsaB
MSLILNIDTATEIAGVSLSKEGKVLQERKNVQQKDHAYWIHIAIEEIVKEHKINVRDISAIAVVAGPGSYTGIRVGMATAKGLAYSLGIPLIILNSLELMAYGATRYAGDSDLLCPMIDARRMEVYTAIYDTTLNILLAPCALILDSDSLIKYRKYNRLLYFGSGSDKWKKLQNHDNALFIDTAYEQSDMSLLSYNCYLEKEFADLAYSSPIYIKEFHSSQPK